MSASAIREDALSVRAADGQARLHVHVNGQGPALLMIHGWPLDQRVFAPQVPELSRELSVITYDRRGFGRSTGTPDLAADLLDIDRILDALSLDRVNLLGMSQGGRIALRYALVNPARVHSLLLQAPAVDGFRASTSDEAIPLDHYADLVRQGRLDELRAAWLSHPMMAAGVHDNATARMLAAILDDYRGADLMHGRAHSVPPVNVAERLSALTMPVLVLTGLLETAARREHAAYLLANLPRAREVVFCDSGHLSNVTEPAAYNQAVLDFCRAAGSAS